MGQQTTHGAASQDTDTVHTTRVLVTTHFETIIGKLTIKQYNKL